MPLLGVSSGGGPVTYVNSSTQSANATSMPVPAGLEAGDLLLYFFAADVAATNSDLPTGFTLGGFVGGTAGGLRWGWRIADGTETTISPIDNGRTTENIHAAVIFRNAEISEVGTFNSGGSSTSVVMPSVPVQVGDFALAVASQDSIVSTVVGTPPAGYTEIVDAKGTEAVIGIAYKSITVAGTESPANYTFSQSSTESAYSTTIGIR